MTDHGTLETRDGRPVLRYERHLAHPIETVWRAITDPDELSTWFPTNVDGDRQPGAQLQFEFRDDEGPSFDGRVLEIDEPSLFAFLWGSDEIRSELASDAASSTNLTFTVGIGDDPDGIRPARDGAGWHVSLDVLADHLDGAPTPPRSQIVERWERVNPDYQDRFAGGS
jgi:hypothetical protein